MITQVKSCALAKLAIVWGNMEGALFGPNNGESASGAVRLARKLSRPANT